MAQTTNKKPRQRVTPANPAPAHEAQPRKTNLALNADTISALGRLKALGYSRTFAIQLGVAMLEASFKSPGRGI